MKSILGIYLHSHSKYHVCCNRFRKFESSFPRTYQNCSTNTSIGCWSILFHECSLNLLASNPERCSHWILRFLVRLPYSFLLIKIKIVIYKILSISVISAVAYFEFHDLIFKSYLIFLVSNFFFQWFSLLRGILALKV